MNTPPTSEHPAPGHPASDLSIEAALNQLQSLAHPITGTEELPIAQALDRILAQDLVSPISVPPHDNSAMDGYAFAGTQLQADQALTLTCVGTVLAGSTWAQPVSSGQCLKIMTGAMMPPGLDTVVPIENVQTAADHVTIPPNTVRWGDNRRLLGEDLMQGQPALRQGERLGPAALGLVASLGLPTVRVVRRLQAAYFSTGNEILSLGQAPRPGAVYDSNRYTVLGLLTRLGAQVHDLGVVPDDPQALEAAFRLASEQADVVITSGGVSVGEADHTQTLMRRLGEVAFWRLAMRPGRPMAVGHLHSGQRPVLLLGLPGNPVATMVTFLALVRPTLLRLMGATATEAVLLQARSQEALRKRPGRTEYQRGIVSHAADGSLQVRTTGAQGSGMLSSMVQANGLIVLKHTQSHVTVGDTVDVLMFDGVM